MVLFVIVFSLLGILFSYASLRILFSQDWAKRCIQAQWNFVGKAMVQILDIGKTLTILRYSAVLTLFGVTFILVFGTYLILS